MNAVFCMDNEASMKTHVSMLEKFGNKNKIPIKIATYLDASELLFHITDREFQTDLIFLDVEIAGESGFQVAEALRERKLLGEIIFLTDVEDQWEKAFDVQAFHYVLEENCSQERFDWIVNKAVQKVTGKKEETLAFSCAGKRVVVPIRDIKYFEVIERWIHVYFDDTHFEFFARLSKIEELLTGKGFIKVHRSFLVSIHHIASVRYNQLSLQDGTEIPIARGKYQEVKSRSERMEDAWE